MIGKPSSRRHAIKLLGGAAAGLLATSGPIARNALAKKTTKTCQPGKRIAYLAVPADGSAVLTPVLERGQPYILRASGYWSTNGDDMNDAVAAFPFANPREPVFFHNGIRLGLSVNGESPDIWGPYDLSHTYTTRWIGEGKRVSLWMLDSFYIDNARLLNVEVLCAAPAKD
jgi:hypothetical protein